jgi:hypothetical protein
LLKKVIYGLVGGWLTTPTFVAWIGTAIARTWYSNRQDLVSIASTWFQSLGIGTPIAVKS